MRIRMKIESYCLEKRTFTKVKSYQNRTTRFSESLERAYYGENEKPTAMFALYDIEQCFNDFKKIVIVNTENDSQTTIKSKKAFKTWAGNTNMLVPPKTIVRCYCERTNYKGDSCTYMREYSWVDYADYEENPMFILQINDNSSGKVIEEKVYKTAGRAHNRIEKYVKAATVEDGAIVYNGKKCGVMLNGLNISEYIINPQNTDLSLYTEYGNWASTVSCSTTVAGLF